MCFSSKALLLCSSTRPLTTMRCSPGMAALRKSMSKLWKKVYPSPSSILLRNSPAAAHADWPPSTDTLDDTRLQPSGTRRVDQGRAGSNSHADLKTSQQVGVLLLVACQHPPQHAGGPVCRVHDAGHGHLHLLLCGLLLYLLLCATVCFLHRKRLVPDPVQPFILAGSGYR